MEINTISSISGNTENTESLQNLGNPQSTGNSGSSSTFMPIIKKKKTNRTPFIVLGVSVAAVLLAGGIYIFSRNTENEMVSPISGDENKVNADARELAENPITGEKTAILSKEDAATLRPLAVMINNHLDARPQSGISKADLTYEIVAEGGITRYIAFFLGETPEKIGPVRSTREYYLVLVKELGDAMLMHIGYSPQALAAIESWPVRSLARGGAEFWRDNPRNVAIEHTAYVDGVYLRKLGQELGWGGRRDFDAWMFKNDKSGYADAQVASNISIDFWYKGDYSSIWKYNPDKNTYSKFTGYDSTDQPIPTMDENTNEQVEVKNLIVQFATENAINGDDKGRLDYTLIGSGEALVFLDGKVVKGTWSKNERDTRTKFYDLNGKEIEYNRGKFWISIVPDRNVDQVVYN
jgi:hypothetical protein